jgi:hypothetical protein
MCVCHGCFSGGRDGRRGSIPNKSSLFHARAQFTTSPRMRAQYENLSKAYLRLAEQADRNEQADIIYEPPPPRKGMSSNGH